MSNSPNNTMVSRMAVTSQGAVCVSLSGDIDLAAEPELATLAGHLAAAWCPQVHIDLHQITFAGSTLINFLFRLTSELPSHSTVSLCRPPLMTRHLIELTGLREATIVCQDLPADWIATWAPTQLPDAVKTSGLA